MAVGRAVPDGLQRGHCANARRRQQSLDMELLRERLNELESRQQQMEASNAEMARLQNEVAVLTARLRQVEVQPAAATPSTATQELSALPPLDRSPSPQPSTSWQPPSQPSMSQAIPAAYFAAAAPPRDLPPIAAMPEPNADASLPAKTDDAHSGYGYGDGLQFGFWGWLGYEASPQEKEASFYAYEAELDVTKSFSDRIAASADIDFYDTNHGAEVGLDQLFISFLFPEWNDAIFTAGKFNAPYGIERRQFWERQTGSVSLLFDAQPEDLTGVMLTNRWDATNLTFRTFVVNGFDVDPDNNQQPSVGMMVEYRPTKCLTFALTNWWGPELPNDNADKMFFTEAQAVWHVTPKLSVSGEFLYGTSQIPGDRANWTGFLVIVDQHLWCDKWRVFLQYSDLNDPYGFVSDEPQHAREGNAGVAWQIDPHVELLAEYRHDIGQDYYGWGPVSDQSDTVSVDLTFGY